MAKKPFFLEILLEILSDVPKLILAALPRESLEYKIMKTAGMNPKQCHQGFYNLKKRKILEENKGSYRFTKVGRRWFENKQFQYFKIKNKKWDGYWRVVIFDIPQILRNKRNDFRKKLKSLNFYQLQKSVFVFPYHCEEELADFCRYLKIGEYVDVLRVNHLGSKEEEIQRYFNKAL